MEGAEGAEGAEAEFCDCSTRMCNLLVGVVLPKCQLNRHILEIVALFGWSFTPDHQLDAYWSQQVLKRYLAGWLPHRIGKES